MKSAPYLKLSTLFQHTKRAKIKSIHRGSYECSCFIVFINYELRKRDKMRGLPSILSIFRNEFNKFNNTGAQMLDSIYHMTLEQLKIASLA